MNKVKKFIDELYSNRRWKNHPTNRILCIQLDEICFLELAHMIDYRTSNHKGVRYIFVLSFNFSKNLKCILLENEYGQTITDELSKILIFSKSRLNKFESNGGAEFYNSIFQNFLKVDIIHQFPWVNQKGPSKAERVIRS